jgi:hypothetical protein
VIQSEETSHVTGQARLFRSSCHNRCPCAAGSEQSGRGKSGRGILRQEGDLSGHSSSRPIQEPRTSGCRKDTGGQPRPRRSVFRSNRYSAGSIRCRRCGRTHSQPPNRTPGVTRAWGLPGRERPFRPGLFRGASRFPADTGFAQVARQSRWGDTDLPWGLPDCHEGPARTDPNRSGCPQSFSCVSGVCRMAGRSTAKGNGTGRVVRFSRRCRDRLQFRSRFLVAADDS